jgi:hypothetical protein
MVERVFAGARARFAYGKLAGRARKAFVDGSVLRGGLSDG